MSAIAGILNLNGEPVSIEQSTGMMKALEKFPANDIQTWHKDNLFLGCHAQWITPESIGEQLPFYDYERRLAITADAIIDNREELFQLLQIDREDQKKITDSQLILLAYHKWGEESPKFLVGDFAYVIWDEKEQKLFGARDFSGSRTLYYFKDGQRFLFCTVMKPILGLQNVKMELNEQWLAEYLAIIGMVDVASASQTVYQNIYQIPPSHSITIKNNATKQRRYTKFDFNTIKLKSTDDYIEAFRDVFQEAIRSRLRTHLNVGAQLSGGLDSGSIVAFGRKLLSKDKPLYAFSYIPPSDFEDFTPRHLLPDERPLIKKTVNYVGGIKEHYLDFSGRDSYSEISSFLDVMEMPYKFFENSFWLKGMYEKASEENVGILLNGGRGNISISWGTALDYYALLLKKFRLIKLFQELNQFSQKVGGSRYRRIPSIAKMAFPALDKSNEEDIISIINPEFAKKTKVYERLWDYGIDKSGWLSSQDIFHNRRRHFEDVFHWNASNTLACKLSLPYSVWKRDPTNDSRVIQFCLSVPEDEYVQNGIDRALIRNATEGYLPDSIRLNQSVRGVQGADWVHRMIPFWDSLIREVQEFSKDGTLLSFVNSDVIQRGFNKIKDNVKPEDAIDMDYKIIMRILVVYRFMKNFTEGR
ncbi:asparagine synthase-related protein [Robertmurraya sp. FSL R5-0851]|uniref:asparagine synthase-related protein n=1 Tax=Robertmurraya sp. FSL R5-0851 TaxID=2921584 RepID=UPI0030FBC291